jgi:hypothetical protein
VSDEATFEGWAILELMGHRRLAGRVSEVELAGHGFLRLDVPEVDGRPGATQFYAPASVYALTPTTEEVARGLRSRPEPVTVWDLQRPALPSREEALDALEEDMDELERDPF